MVQPCSHPPLLDCSSQTRAFGWVRGIVIEMNSLQSQCPYARHENLVDWPASTNIPPRRKPGTHSHQRCQIVPPLGGQRLMRRNQQERRQTVALAPALSSKNPWFRRQQRPTQTLLDRRSCCASFAACYVCFAHMLAILPLHHLPCCTRRNRPLHFICMLPLVPQPW